MSQFKIIRRIIGGPWSLWGTTLPMAGVWVRGWQRPPCGDVRLKTEFYERMRETDDSPCTGCNGTGWDRQRECVCDCSTPNAGASD